MSIQLANERGLVSRRRIDGTKKAESKQALKISVLGSDLHLLRSTNHAAGLKSEELLAVCTL